MLTIHEEFARLILRRRWVLWANRKLDGQFAAQMPRLIYLSGRLTRFRPCYEERMRCQTKA